MLYIGSSTTSGVSSDGDLTGRRATVHPDARRAQSLRQQHQGQQAVPAMVAAPVGSGVGSRQVYENA